MMIDYFIYEATTGKLLQTGSCIEPDYELQKVPAGCAVAKGRADLFGEYFDGSSQQLTKIPPRPNIWHEWSWETHEWVLLETALTKAKQEKKTQVETMRQVKNAAPLFYEEALFDADERAQSNVMAWMVNITNGLSVPSGFVWRDANNIDRPADEAFITGLGAAMVQRGSLLYQQAWQQKAAIDALTSISEVEEFVTAF